MLIKIGKMAEFVLMDLGNASDITSSMTEIYWMAETHYIKSIFNIWIFFYQFSIKVFLGRQPCFRNLFSLSQEKWNSRVAMLSKLNTKFYVQYTKNSRTNYSVKKIETVQFRKLWENSDIVCHGDERKWET